METKVVTFTRRVAAPGERARIANKALKARSAVVRACTSNRGRVFVGDFMVGKGDPGLNPGRAIGLRGYPRVDLQKMFVDSEFAGDGVEVTVSEMRAVMPRKEGTTLTGVNRQ